MKLSTNNFLYTIKQIVTGNNRDNNNKSFDGGIKSENRLSLDDIVNTAAFPSITDSTGGTASATFSANSVKQTVLIPLGSMSSLANGQTFRLPMPFAFTITGTPQFRADVAITTGAKAATLTTQVNTTNTTGGVISVAGTYATGATQAASAAVTALGVGAAGDTVTIAVSSVTAFTEGTGHVELTVINNDLANTQAEIAKVLNAMSNSNSSINSGKQGAFIIPSGSNPAIGFLNIPIPRDYDEASDTFSIKIFASLANADAAITITGTPTIQLIGVAATTGSAVSAKAPFSTAASTALTTTEAVYEINLSLLGLKRDAILSVALNVAGTTTGNLVIQAIEYIYDSTIVSYNETDSTTNTNSSTGNLLR